MHASDFARQEFDGAPLGDKRLSRRLLKIVESLLPDPSRSLPEASGAWAATKAVYRFCSNPSVFREEVMAPHRNACVRRLSLEPEVLVVEDTTFLNFTRHPATKGLGPIGDTTQDLWGALLHSALVVKPRTHEVLGLLEQDVIRRRGYRPAKETSAQRRRRARESQKWLSVAQRALAHFPDPSRAIFVFDREGDIFDVVQGLRRRGARFVIRSGQNRRVKIPGAASPTTLRQALRQATRMGSRSVRIPARGGRPAREATLEVWTGHYFLQAPGKKGEEPVGVVWAKEAAAPKSSQGLEWILYSSRRIDRAEEAYELLDHYAGRWKIEEWHKALKTGCRIEERELETWEGLEVLVGIFSVIAWKLVAMRDQAARAPDEEVSEDLLEETERKVLRAMDPSLGAQARTRDYLRAIARLGGFLARRRDGDPGWITLWRGYRRLQERVAGFNLARGTGRCG